MRDIAPSSVVRFSQDFRDAGFDRPPWIFQERRWSHTCHGPYQYCSSSRVHRKKKASEQGGLPHD